MNDSEGDVYVCVKLASEKGECRKFRDHNTGSLSFEKLVDDSRYLHGWLDRSIVVWQAMLFLFNIYEEPWYSFFCGEEPKYMGDIRVRLFSKTKMKTQFKFSDEDEGQPPVVFILKDRDASSERDLRVPLT